MTRSTRTDGSCGVVEVWDLDNYWAAQWDEKRDDAATIPFVLKGHMAGIAFATTSSEGNYRESLKHLREHGFHEVLTTRNPKTGNNITLWVRDLSEGKLPNRLARPPWIVVRVWKAVQFTWAYLMRSRWNPRGAQPKWL